jgi:mono/diheme cytochrome c family protein
MNARNGMAHSLSPKHLLWIAGFILALAWLNPALAQGDGGLLEEGAAVYELNCLVCHGEQGQGRVGATLAKDWPSIRPDLTIKNVINIGVPGSAMPAWSQDKGGPLSESEIDALVAYILSWETGEPFDYIPRATATFRPPITPLAEMDGDPNRGAVLYDENCAVCHGPEGQGRVGATLAKDWPAIRPDISIRIVIANGIPGSAMPAWSQDKGGPMADQDIADMTAFIQTLPVVSSGGGIPTAAPTGAYEGMGGITGILVTLVLFTLIVALILFVQRKQPQA